MRRLEVIATTPAAKLWLWEEAKARDQGQEVMNELHQERAGVMAVLHLCS